MEQNYITILVESLEKKIKVLQEISQENRKQKGILQAEELDMDAFQSSIDKKSELIEQVSFLDDGFEKMYDRVRDTLHGQREQYQQEISQLKQLISKITDMTVIIEKEERDNRNLAELQFSKEKKKMRQVKNSKQVATKYYENMAKLNYVDPQFMDKKK